MFRKWNHLKKTALFILWTMSFYTSIWDGKGLETRQRLVSILADNIKKFNFMVQVKINRSGYIYFMEKESG